MDFLGGSATGFRHERRAESAKDLRTGAYGDWQFDLPAESHRGSKAELRRDLQGGLQEDCRSDFDGVSRMESEALGLSYSTVTLLARLRGLSTSQPRMTATW